MIVKTTKKINGVEYDYAYSDSGMKIIRDGVEYDDALDPAGSGRIYTESSTPRQEEVPMTETEERAMAYDILTGVME